MPSEDIKRNPYTGMDMAVPGGNGEVVKVEDLINKPQKDWEQFTPKDTLENSDSDLHLVYERLSEVNRGVNKSVKLEEFMNSNNSGGTSNNSPSDGDSLISDLTGILNM